MKTRPAVKRRYLAALYAEFADEDREFGEVRLSDYASSHLHEEDNLTKLKMIQTK